jgi:hypothetical protein
METKLDFEQQRVDSCDDSEPKLTEGLGTSRRKFTRNVLVGSAVLLTLSNRSAWGDKILVCASTNLLMSYRTGQPSAFTEDQQKELNNFEYYRSDAIQEPEDMSGVTCYERTQPNGNSD